MLCRPTVRRSLRLGVLSPRGTPVGPSWGVVLITPGFLFSKGLYAVQLAVANSLRPMWWPEARLQERFRLVCVCGSSGLEVCAVAGERLFLPSLPDLVASWPLFVVQVSPELTCLH